MPKDNPIPTPSAQEVFDNAMIDALEAASDEASKKLSGKITFDIEPPRLTYTYESGFKGETGWRPIPSGPDLLVIARYTHNDEEWQVVEIFNDSKSRSEIESEFKQLAERARDNQIADAEK